jgi:cytochrome c-type biogenesis protein CcmH
MINAASPIELAVFWLAILGALVVAAWWVLRASAISQSDEDDRADLKVYADQVSELDRDLAQGRIAPQAAEAGRLEIGRRLVKAQNRQLVHGIRANRAVLGVLAASVAFLAGGLYFTSGSPGKADLPFHKREQELLARDPATLTGDEIMLLLQERARLNPDDPKPHALMGQVLTTAGRDQEALRAYQAVLRRTPNDSEAIAEAGGILMRLNDNQLGDDAKAALTAALSVDPKSPTARFYMALVDWQKGQKAQAFAAWRDAYLALNDRPEAQNLLAARVVQVMSQLDRGPGEGAAALSPQSAQDQGAFIASMIAGRQARLLANPGDVALRLSVVRVLIMNGQAEEARKALLAGAERAQNQPFTIALYEIAALSLPQNRAPVPTPK